MITWVLLQRCNTHLLWQEAYPKLNLFWNSDIKNFEKRNLSYKSICSFFSWIANIFTRGSELKTLLSFANEINNNFSNIYWEVQNNILTPALLWIFGKTFGNFLSLLTSRMAWNFLRTTTEFTLSLYLYMGQLCGQFFSTSRGSCP